MGGACCHKNSLNVKGSTIRYAHNDHSKENETINNIPDNNNKDYDHSSMHDSFQDGAEKDIYRKLSSEGKGKFGEVSKVIVYDVNNNDQFIYAIKTIDIGDPVKEKSGYRECNALSHCHHPNIISLRTIFRQKISLSTKTLNIVTEYVNGGNLEEKLNNQLNGKKEYDENTLIFWLFQICIGLSYLHKKKVIHRDIKPANILLTENGLIKIADLGLAKVYNSEKQLDRKNTKAGTPYYMSLEMKLTGIYDEKTDLYSLGSTFKKFLDSKTIIYSEEFKNLINSLCDDDPKQRPSADEILKQPKIKGGMELFMEKYKYKESNAYLIMQELNNNKDNEKYNDDSFISSIKAERKKILSKKYGDDNKHKDNKNTKDLDILMCIIASLIK